MSVYPVREDTLLVKRNLEEQDLEDKDFLEIGVGNGENTVLAAEKRAKATGVDINPEAIKHTQERIKENDLEAELFLSNLFEQVEGKFDFIIFNPPYLKGEEGIGDEEMWRGGETGLEAAERFLKKVPAYLTDGGKAWIILSSQTEYEKLVEKFNLEQVESEKIWFETLFLMKFE
ncbi:HemK2/MTQ2 family protein methyltransferase [Candidatus Nanohalobium constans]|uniref:Release factor glutamine methyltransferase n=1 Tax=Candidatus Nanohalobium constans TaxID=2565781 RepID=A0A5Q0UFI3_9ARCH|nr:HemK2/MTQ2 family protein methyltransferase [Candidatus Nanohalobium constans]QGA80348.1 release factor glutamine methyltransferase [Candidatus Nanohalobium constans]